MADYGGAISLSQGRDLSHTSDEDDDSDISPRSLPTLSCGVVGGGGSSAGGKGGSSSSSLKPRKSPAGGDEMIGLEISKKPRGRPPGSKNKPKPPVFITKDSDLSLKPVVLEISAGSDVVESLMQFARRRRVGITVLSGTGSVSNVTLRHPVSHAPAMSLHGPFGLLSLSGSFAASSSSSSPSSPSPSPSSSSPPSSSSSSSSSAALSCCSSFGICLAGAQGQVFGGIVGGKVIAASLVVVVAATFLSPGFHRLPGGGGGDHHDHQVEEAKPCIRSITGGAVSVAGNEGGSCGGDRVGSSTAMSMSVFNVSSPNPISCQISPDVMPWGPTSRPPPY